MARRQAPSVVESSSPVVALDALGLLAARFEDEGRPLQATHCLLAALGLKPLPDAEAKARCQIGRLLLAHTNNLTEARDHLQKAQLLADKLLGGYSLKCEIRSQLGLCYKMLAEPRFETDVLRQGLEICRVQLTNGTADRHNMARWSCFFQQRLAEAAWEAGRTTDARTWATRGLQQAQQENLLENQVVFMLLRLQLSLAEWDSADAAQAMAELTAVAGDSDLMATLPRAFLTQTMLQFSTLQVLDQLRQGQYAQLLPAAVLTPEEEQQDVEDQAAGRVPDELLVIRSMRRMLTEVRDLDTGFSPILAADVLDALLHVVAALILRGSKIVPALSHLHAACSLLDAHLEALGVVAASTPESALSSSLLWRCRTPLLLKVMVCECQAQIHLLQSNPAAAGAVIMEAAHLLHLHPHLLRRLRPTVHLLAGQYCHLMEQYDAAINHLDAARCGALGPMAEASAATLLAMTLVAAGRPNAVSQAIDVMGEMYRTDRQGLGYCERANAHLAAAIVKIKLGEVDEAQYRLKKAMKQAHHKLNSLNVVSCVFGHLAPLMLAAGDMVAAKQMATTSISSSKAEGDLLGLCHLMPIMAKVQRCANNAAGTADAERSWADKVARLQARRAAALSRAQQHDAIVRLSFPLDGAGERQ